MAECGPGEVKRPGCCWCSTCKQRRRQGVPLSAGGVVPPPILPFSPSSLPLPCLARHAAAALLTKRLPPAACRLRPFPPSRRLLCAAAAAGAQLKRLLWPSAVRLCPEGVRALPPPIAGRRWQTPLLGGVPDAAVGPTPVLGPAVLCRSPVAAAPRCGPPRCAPPLTCRAGTTAAGPASAVPRCAPPLTCCHSVTAVTASSWLCIRKRVSCCFHQGAPAAEGAGDVPAKTSACAQRQVPLAGGLSRHCTHCVPPVEALQLARQRRLSSRVEPRTCRHARRFTTGP